MYQNQPQELSFKFGSFSDEFVTFGALLFIIANTNTFNYMISRECLYFVRIPPLISSIADKSKNPRKPCRQQIENDFKKILQKECSPL